MGTYRLYERYADYDQVERLEVSILEVWIPTFRTQLSYRAPFLVVLKDRGQTLRFYRPGQIRVQAEVLREFLKRGAWDRTEPWRSAFGPGGSRYHFALLIGKRLLTSV